MLKIEKTLLDTIEGRDDWVCIGQNRIASIKAYHTIKIPRHMTFNIIRKSILHYTRFIFEHVTDNKTKKKKN